MEEDASNSCDLEYEDEYVLLDLDEVSAKVCIPPDAPYTLLGLDTLHPVLIIDNKLKLVGEYEETIGTCVVFNEDKKSDPKARATTQKKLGASGAKTSKQPVIEEVRPVGSLHKILKFRLATENEEGANNTMKKAKAF